jgi:hypothetical protein
MTMQWPAITSVWLPPGIATLPATATQTSGGRLLMLRRRLLALSLTVALAAGLDAGQESARGQPPPRNPATQALLDQAEQASQAYAAQFSTLPKHLAIVTGETDTDEPDERSMGEFEYIYAFRDKPDDSLYIERAQVKMTVESADGTSQTRTGRYLKGEFLIMMEEDRNVRDYSGDPPASRPKLEMAWDPFSAPLIYYASLKQTTPNNYRSIAALVMPPGRLLDAQVDGQGRSVGRWHAGRPTNPVLVEVVFDPQFGSMPTEMRVRTLKPGVKTLDIADPIGCTELYQTSETTWFQHASGHFLPSEVRCVKSRGTLSGWKLQIEWWLGDEVPDEVFNIGDVFPFLGETATINKLIASRLKQKREAEKQAEMAKAAP